jgi:hypothetical protein
MYFQTLATVAHKVKDCSPGLLLEFWNHRYSEIARGCVEAVSDLFLSEAMLIYS